MFQSVFLNIGGFSKTPTSCTASASCRTAGLRPRLRGACLACARLRFQPRLRLMMTVKQRGGLPQGCREPAQDPPPPCLPQRGGLPTNSPPRSHPLPSPRGGSTTFCRQAVPSSAAPDTARQSPTVGRPEHGSDRAREALVCHQCRKRREEPALDFVHRLSPAARVCSTDIYGGYFIGRRQ